MAKRAKVTIRHDPEATRYEAVDESGDIAGIAEYVHRDGRLVFVHTEVLDEFEGRGVGSTLARGALDHVRGTGQPVLVECPFLRAYIKKHPEYQDLLAA